MSQIELHMCFYCKSPFFGEESLRKSGWEAVRSEMKSKGWSFTTHRENVATGMVTTECAECPLCMEKPRSITVRDSLGKQVDDAPPSDAMPSDLQWQQIKHSKWTCRVGPLLVAVMQGSVPIVNGIYRIAKPEAWRWVVSWVDERYRHEAVLDLDRSDGGYEDIEAAKADGVRAAVRVRDLLR